MKREALKKGRFVLSSGKESSFYLDGRVITMLPEGASLTAQIILRMLEVDMPDAIGGPTLGADPIVGAICAEAYGLQVPLKGFIVRKAAKGHGTQKQVEGPALNPSERVVLIDDVATSGKSLVEAKEVLSGMNVSVLKAVVIVDRNEGARDALLKAGCPLESIFTLADLGV